MNGELAKLVLAVQFLTRLPLRTDKMFTPERMAQAPRYFPLVGILVGLVSAGVFWIVALVPPQKKSNYFGPPGALPIDAP